MRLLELRDYEIRVYEFYHFTITIYGYNYYYGRQLLILPYMRHEKLKL